MCGAVIGNRHFNVETNRTWRLAEKFDMEFRNKPAINKCMALKRNYNNVIEAQ